MYAVGEEFEILDKNDKVLYGYYKVTAYLMMNVNIDFTAKIYKCLMVIRRHLQLGQCAQMK